MSDPNWEFFRHAISFNSITLIEFFVVGVSPVSVPRAASLDTSLAVFPRWRGRAKYFNFANSALTNLLPDALGNSG